MKEASFYSRERNGQRCGLCPHGCLIREGQRGICGVRVDREGRLYAEGYGRVSSIALDPMEKKPLYHFYPGSMILSVGGLGCNLSCSFCQNWEIAHNDRDTKYMAPQALIDLALAYSSVGLAFTYNEPVINYEYIKDTAVLGNANGLKMVLITNGFIEHGPLKEILPYIDAMNIDVKGFSSEFYKKVCGGELGPVKRSVELARGYTHIEITTLVIKGLNDDPDDMEMLFKWIRDIDSNIPLHLSRYFPNYKLTLDATPIDAMIRLKERALDYLPYVYLGNIGGMDTNTYCPRCHKLIVKRDSYSAHVQDLNSKGRCVGCENPMPIVIDRNLLQY